MPVMGRTQTLAERPKLCEYHEHALCKIALRKPNGWRLFFLYEREKRFEEGANGAPGFIFAAMGLLMDKC